MKNMLCALLVSSFVFVSAPAVSGPASDMLGRCMTDALTGKERKQLAQWIFFAMSAHPEISGYARVTPADREEIDRVVGQLITRLLADDCPREVRLVLDTEGSVALQGAFELVGQVAMQELMANERVNGAISNFEKYLDEDKLNAVMGGE